MQGRLFAGFANVWTPVALATQLRAGARLGVQVAGTRVVLFRDKGGRPAALVDVCPHRGVALSLGKVQDGCIECPFHGWTLDGRGQVQRVPWAPDAKLETLRGTPLPARDFAQQIWIYTAPGVTAPTEPEAHEALFRPEVRLSGTAVEWKAHWTRAMENMLDWPHLPFVHRRSIGRRLRARVAEGRMDIQLEERSWGAHTEIAIDGQPQPGSLDFRWPNQMNLHLGVPGRLLMITVACVPVDEARTRMLLFMVRDFMTSAIFDPLINWMNLRIATEDRAIVESSSPAEVPEAGEERSVRTDKPTLYFRKRYHAELREGSESPGQRRVSAAETDPAG